VLYYFAVIKIVSEILLQFKLVSVRFFHSRTVHLDIIRVFYVPTDEQKSCFKNNIEIYIKTAPTCFGLTLILLKWKIR